MMEYVKPNPIKFIEDLDSLKVFADPLRNQILEILSPEPLTVNQIAEKLGLGTSKLYYHINLLEKHGFINMVDTTVKANIIEKHYWLAAYECKLDESLCNFSTPEGQESVTTTLVGPIETTREDIIRSLQARATALEQGAPEHPRHVIIYRELRLVSDETAENFMDKLRALTQEFEAIENQGDGEDTHTRALTIAFYPSFYYDEPKDEEV